MGIASPSWIPGGVSIVISKTPATPASGRTEIVADNQIYKRLLTVVPRQCLAATSLRTRRLIIPVPSSQIRHVEIINPNQVIAAVARLTGIFIASSQRRYSRLQVAGLFAWGRRAASERTTATATVTPISSKDRG